MTYPSLPASLIDPDGLFELAYTEAGFIPLLSPSPYGGLRARAGENDNLRRPASDGVRDRSAAKLNPVDVSPQERLSVAGSHLVHLPGAGFRLQFQTASVTSPTGATAGASSGSSTPLRLFQFVPIVKAIGSLLSPLVNRLQQATRGIANVFGSSFASAVFHDRNLAKDHEHEVQRNQAIGA